MAKKYALLRMRASTSEAEPVTEVNIIPVIDISLVLLVILFISAPLLSYPNLPIQLPHAFAPPSEQQTVALTYTTKGNLAVGIVMVDWPQLVPRIKEALLKSPEATVILRIDKTVPYLVVEKLMTAAKEAGAKRVAIGTEKPK